LTEAEIATEEAFTQNNALGFHIPGRWDKILDLKNCYLQPEPSNSIRNAVKGFAIANNLTFFNARNQTGFLRTLMIRTSSTGEVMVLVQFFHEDKTSRELLLNFILDKFPQVTSLQYVINTKPNDTLYDQEVICYHGKPIIEEEMEGLRFPIHAKSFYQTNSAQAYELYKIVREFAGLTGKELVYDLYTGIGTIAQFVAKNAKRIVGIEAVPEAIADGKRCAETNKIHNVSFYVGDMKTLLSADFVGQLPIRHAMACIKT
jgi:23S rRNA (uracil1939-C5)-methyltransferase